jgi:uncharacterized membrane protein YphA (DoxX/SURF4 family)
LLRLGLGVALLLAGLDKFFDVLATWSMYLSPVAEKLLPVSDATALRAAGVAEMLLGLALLSRWTRVAAYVASAWFTAIAVNLALTGNFWDLMLRDLVIAISAFTLGRLTAWHEAISPSPSRSAAPDASSQAGSGRRGGESLDLAGAHPAASRRTS